MLAGESFVANLENALLDPAEVVQNYEPLHVRHHVLLVAVQLVRWQFVGANKLGDAPRRHKVVFQRPELRRVLVRQHFSLDLSLALLVRVRLAGQIVHSSRRKDWLQI